MMEDHEFCDNCPGCRPAMLDMQTNQPLDNDNPIMVVVNDIWDNNTTYAQRRAFIEFTLHNSRESYVVKLTAEVQNKLQSVLEALE